MESFLISEQEEKTRKRWLFWQVKIPLFFISLYFIFFTVLVFLNKYSNIFLDLTLGFLFASLIAAMFYIPYYCAYKKPGTKLLLCQLILMAISFVFSLGNLVVFYSQNPSFNLALPETIWFILASLFNGWIFYLSYKLRKINQKIKARLLLKED